MRTKPGLRIVHVGVGLEVRVGPERGARPLPHITPAKAAPRRRVGGDFPLDLKRQAPPGPAAPGVGLKPGHVHGGLVALHAHGLAKAGLHHGAAGHTDLVNITGPSPALILAFSCGHALQPAPAIWVPELGAVIAAVVYKLDKLRPGHGLRVDFKLGHVDSVRRLFVVKSKARPRSAAQLPGGRRYQEGLAHGHRGRRVGLKQGPVKLKTQRLCGVNQRFGMHVLMEQTQAVKVKRVVFVTGFGQQLQRAFKGVEQISAGLIGIGQGQRPAGVVRYVGRVPPVVGVGFN